MIRKNDGFTLIELFISFAVFVILATILTTGYFGWKPRYQLRTATDNIHSVLQLAKLHAIRENLEVIVSFDPDGDGNYDGEYVAFEDDGGGGFTWEPANEALVKEGEVPRGITIDTNFANTGKGTRFNSRGLNNAWGTITVSNSDGTQRDIVVSLAGNIRID